MSIRISVRNLHKAYGDYQILRGVDVDINAGELVALYGPSGSGKTTLLNMISTLDNPTAGNIEVNGARVTQFNERERVKFRQSMVSFIFQSDTLLPTYTAIENIDLILRLRKVGYKERQQRAKSALASVGLSAWSSHIPSELSGGQRQRVAIARALSAQSPIILADEPTSGLDTQTTRRIVRLFRDHAERYGTTFLIVSHDPLLAEYIDTTYDLRDGKLIRRTATETPLTRSLETPIEVQA